MDLITYFEKFKAMKEVVEEFNQTANGHLIVEILCREQNINADDLGPAEATQFIADDKEVILDMQLIMDAGRSKYGTLIKGYNRNYLSGINKCQKILQDAYSLLKGWNKHKTPGQKYPSKVGVSFNTVGEENIVNDGAKRSTCSC